MSPCQRAQALVLELLRKFPNELDYSLSEWELFFQTMSVAFFHRDVSDRSAQASFFLFLSEIDDQSLMDTFISHPCAFLQHLFAHRLPAIIAANARCPFLCYLRKIAISSPDRANALLNAGVVNYIVDGPLTFDEAVPDTLSLAAALLQSEEMSRRLLTNDFLEAIADFLSTCSFVVTKAVLGFIYVMIRDVRDPRVLEWVQANLEDFMEALNTAIDTSEADLCGEGLAIAQLILERTGQVGDSPLYCVFVENLQTSALEKVIKDHDPEFALIAQSLLDAIA
jgi:hypothetical protein